MTLYEIKTKYEKRIEKIIDEHKSAIKSVMLEYEYELGDMVEHYEVKIEKLETQVEKLIRS
jgi:DNA-binding transcriptional regulator GbsR (MarR family)